ncbi:MAG: ATP synthase F0 subunit B [Desulfatirhabdiaceae bacterium]
MEIISKVALISINETFFFQLVSFLIFMFIVTRIMFRPLQGAMDDRNTHFEKLNMDISDVRDKLNRMMEQVRQSELKVKYEAFDMRNQMEEEGQQAAKQVIDDASQKAAEKKEASMKEVTNQITQARNQIQLEVEGVTTLIMEQLLGRRLS